MMGDNRGKSLDSRRWGFVEDAKLVGKAFAIWVHKDPGLNWPTFRRNGLIELTGVHHEHAARHDVRAAPTTWVGLASMDGPNPDHKWHRDMLAIRTVPHYIDFYTMVSVVEALPKNQVHVMSKKKIRDSIR